MKTEDIYNRLLELAIQWSSEAKAHDENAALCFGGEDSCLGYALASQCREHTAKIEEILYLIQN